MDVPAWLRQSGFGEYAASFAENRIDVAVLLQLNDGDLKELGVGALGDRKKLLAAIAALVPPAAGTAADQPSAVGPLVYTPRHLATRILDARSRLEGERKHVTVLFADIKGSTALIENLDPEDAARKLGPAISLMMTSVHEYEGTVNKVQGDGIMALFGAPLAHEDHAVRACLAALAIRDAVAASGENAVGLRIGLHSGEVLVRAIHNDLSMDYDAIGPTVHLAGRMEQMAPPGRIHITAATNALARDFVKTRSLGPTEIKGISRAVEVFELLDHTAARTRWDARATHELTAFVGRSGELDTLLKAAARTRAAHGELVALVGDAGMGKSRLAHEMLRTPQLSGWSLRQTGAVPYGSNAPFLPVSLLLRSMFGIEARDDGSEIDRKLRDGLGPRNRDATALLQVVQFLLNVPVDDPAWERLDPQQRGNRVIDELTRFLLQATKDQPLLLVVEDLHWIDPETQRLLNSLADGVPAHRLLLLVTYRPEYRHPWASKSYYTQIRVDPLESAKANDMLDTLLGTGPDLDALKSMLIERTEGRPLFLEELVRGLKESGILVERDGALHLEGNVAQINLPGSVQDVLASRIDRLAPELKRLLQTASVIGRTVPVQLLEKIAALTGDVIADRLGRLQEAEFLYEQHGSADPTFQFKHALTEEVAYASLPQETRRSLHGQLVAAMEHTYADRLEEHCEALGRHALRAERWDKAYLYSRKAAHKAHARSAYRSAIEWFDRALAALDRLPDDGMLAVDKMDVRLEMRTALWPLGRHDELAQRVREAGAIAERVGDKARLANVYNYLTAHHWQAGEHGKAIETGERGLALAQEAGDFSVTVTTMQHLGFALIARGEFERQTAYHREVARRLTGEAMYRRHGMAGYPAAITRGMLAWGLAELGVFEEALESAQEGVAIARKVNSAMSIVWVTDYLALAHMLRGEPERALELMEPNFELCRKAEVRIVHSLTAGILGWALTELGRAEDALPLFDQTVLPGNLQHHPDGAGYPRVWFALAYRAVGRLDDGLAQARQALDTAQSQGEKGHEAWAWFAMGEIEAGMDGLIRQAKARYGAALAIADERGMRPLAARCRSRLLELRARPGQTNA